MIWDLLIFSNGPLKVIGTPLPPNFYAMAQAGRPVRSNVPMLASAYPNGRITNTASVRGYPQRDSSKYKIRKTHLVPWLSGYTNNNSTKRDPYHHLTPAFTCRVLYYEITPLYYRKIEHDIPPPYACSVHSHHEVKETLLLPEENPIMFDAIGKHNIERIS